MPNRQDNGEWQTMWVSNSKIPELPYTKFDKGDYVGNTTHPAKVKMIAPLGAFRQ